MADKPTVFVTRPLPDTVIGALAEFSDPTVRQETLPMSTTEMAEALTGYDAVLPTLGDPLGADAYGGQIKSKLLANFGVGYNHIDVAAAEAAGMVVSNTPGAVTDATADIAILLMLMSARRQGLTDHVMGSVAINRAARY